MLTCLWAFLCCLQPRSLIGIAFEVSMEQVRKLNIAIRNTSLKFRKDISAWHTWFRSKLWSADEFTPGKVWSINSKDVHTTTLSRHPTSQMPVLLCWDDIGTVLTPMSLTSTNQGHCFRNIGTAYGFIWILAFNYIFLNFIFDWHTCHSQEYYFYNLKKISLRMIPYFKNISEYYSV